MSDFFSRSMFIANQKKVELDVTIYAENLKAAAAEQFISKTFADGELKTAGTAVIKLLPAKKNVQPILRARIAKGVLRALLESIRRENGVKMTYYLRVMLGGQSSSARECFRDEIVGTDFGFIVDLTKYLKPTWTESKKDLSKLYRESHPGKSPIAIGLNCGSIWTVSKGIPIGGIVISPTGEGDYTFA